jgi:hypothetical protein
MKGRLAYLLFIFLGLITQAYTPKHFKAGTFAPSPNPPANHEDFSAVYDGQKVLLSWNTANEKKVDYYTVEKAKDGIHFSAALIIKGAGDHPGSLDYRETDYAPYSGVSYYRLKKTDHSGNVSYSSVFPVNFQYAKDGSLHPADGKTPDAETMKKVEKKEVLVLVRDAQGNEYTAKIKVTRDQDEKLYAMDDHNHLGKGSYLILASSFNALYAQKITVR